MAKKAAGDCGDSDFAKSVGKKPVLQVDYGAFGKQLRDWLNENMRFTSGAGFARASVEPSPVRAYLPLPAVLPLRWRSVG